MKKLDLDEIQEQEVIQKKSKNKENSFVEVPGGKTSKKYVSPIDGSVLNSNNIEIDSGYKDSEGNDEAIECLPKHRQSYLVKEHSN